MKCAELSKDQNEIRGSADQKNQHRLKWFLPDGSAGALWLTKRYPLTLILVFLTGSHIMTRYPIVFKSLMDPIPNPIFPEKCSRVQTRSGSMDFSERKNPEYDFLRKRSKTVVDLRHVREPEAEIREICRTFHAHCRTTLMT